MPRWTIYCLTEKQEPRSRGREQRGDEFFVLFVFVRLWPVWLIVSVWQNHKTLFFKKKKKTYWRLGDSAETVWCVQSPGNAKPSVRQSETESLLLPTAMPFFCFCFIINGTLAASWCRLPPLLVSTYLRLHIMNDPKSTCLKIGTCRIYRCVKVAP